MTWLGMKYNLPEIKSLLLNELKNRYSHVEMADGIQFITGKGRPFNVFVLGDSEPFGCFVIEHEDTGEDGDMYYPEDYKSFEEMLHAMLTEIEG